MTSYPYLHHSSTIATLVSCGISCEEKESSAAAELFLIHPTTSSHVAAFLFSLLKEIESLRKKIRRIHGGEKSIISVILERAFRQVSSRAYALSGEKVVVVDSSTKTIAMDRLCPVHGHAAYRSIHEHGTQWSYTASDAVYLDHR